jgi:hypothetical protein
MRKEMEVLYVEGVAIHDGPESCAVACEGEREALTGGVWAGLLSREISIQIRVPTLSKRAEGHVADGVIASRLVDPARSENPGTHADSHAREPGGPMIARGSWLMPRPGWFAGWGSCWWWAVRGTPMAGSP